jgi:adenylate kinase family enzyme
VQTPKDVYLDRVKVAVAGERWIFDGTNTTTLDLRIPLADTIIWLQRPRFLCMLRIVRRVLTSYGQVRGDMAPGCPEKFDWEFVKWVWNFPRVYDPKIRAALDRHTAWSRTVTLRTDADASAFLHRDVRLGVRAPTPIVA